MYRGDWFVTFSGCKIYILDPDPKEIYIKDIAHALSNLCRFNGHVREFYSVAQHSVLVSRHVPKEHAREALLHDAAEAYLGDVIRPLKKEVVRYTEIENLWQETIRSVLCPDPLDLSMKEAIAKRFSAHESIKRVDKEALVTERRDLIPHECMDAGAWTEDVQGIQPWDDVIAPLPPKEAEMLFLTRWGEV